MSAAVIALVGAAALASYTYVGYPLALIALRPFRRGKTRRLPEGAWPTVSISLPVFNEAHQVGEVIESLLAIDYPADRLQILVVSDASTDGTDEIVRGYAARGVELLRQPERRGKTAAENAAGPHLRGEIVVNTDASIRIRPGALKELIRPFADPTVGLASGRDVSVGSDRAETNRGEAGYVGYEMWVRELETDVAGIVGASGCFYAIRRHLHLLPLPEALSRDFAAALHTREHGLRAVSVSAATCLVPRAPSLGSEYRRKVRTMVRGMATLRHKRQLLNPFRHGWFSWMLFSHKVCRWALPWAMLVGLVGLAALALDHRWAALALAAALAGIMVGAVGWALAAGRRLPALLSVPAYALMGNVSALQASVLAMRGSQQPLWQPTRRAP